MQQFYRPSGDSTQKRGVLSDIELPSLTTHLDVGEADLDYPIAFDHIDPMSYKKFDLRHARARRRSSRAFPTARVKASEKFQKLEQRHRPLSRSKRRKSW